MLVRNITSPLMTHCSRSFLWYSKQSRGFIRTAIIKTAAWDTTTLPGHFETFRPWFIQKPELPSRAAHSEGVLWEKRCWRWSSPLSRLAVLGDNSSKRQFCLPLLCQWDVTSSVPSSVWQQSSVSVPAVEGVSACQCLPPHYHRSDKTEDGVPSDGWWTLSAGVRVPTAGSLFISASSGIYISLFSSLPSRQECAISPCCYLNISPTTFVSQCP